MSNYKPLKSLNQFIVLLLFLACQDLPNPIANNDQSWTKLGPGGGGSTFKPTFSYHDPEIFLLRCDMTGTYLSNTGGASYDQINFPGGSSSFAFDAKDSTVIYIGSKTLNKSTDGGENWKQVFPASDEIIEESFRGDHADYRFSIHHDEWENVGQGRISTISVDPAKPNLYFGMGKHFYYSKNDAMDWNVIGFEESIDYIYTNQEELSTTILVFTPNKLYVVDKSDWSYFERPYPLSMTNAFSFSAGSKSSNHTLIYALSNEDSRREHGAEAPTKVWISSDLGLNWQELEDRLLRNIGETPPTFSKLAASESNPNVVYVVTSSYQETKENGEIAHWYGTLKSEDGGQQWQWVWKGGGGSGQYAVRDGQDANNLKDSWVQEAFGGEYIRIIDVGVSPKNPDVAIVTDWYRAMKTVDGGDNWVEIYSQPNGKGFTSRGLDVTTTYGVHFDPFDPKHIAVSYTDIGFHHSYDGGATWSRSTTGIPPEWHNTCYWLVFDPEVKDKIWSVWSGLHDFPRGKMTRNPKWPEYRRGGVAISEDGGKTWNPSVNGMGFDSPATSIVLDPNSPIESRTLYTSVYGKGVYKSIDGGISWTLQNQGISGSLAAFELTLTPDGTLYLITSPTPQHVDGDYGREVFFGSLYKSEDGAESWQQLNPGTKVLFPNGLTYDPTEPERIYLGAWSDIQLSDLIGGTLARNTGGNQWFDLDGGIHMSEDGGQTWLQIFDANHYVYDVTVDPDNPNRLYCNTFDRGAYFSEDRGKTWIKMAGYDFHWGHRVIVDPHNKGMVYLTTFGSSLWHGSPVSSE